MRAFLFFAMFLFLSGCGKAKPNPYALNKEDPVKPEEFKAEQKKGPPEKKTGEKKSVVRVSSQPVEWQVEEKKNIEKQERFDRGLETILLRIRQEDYTTALQSTRDLLERYPDDPYFRMQLHYLEGELKLKISGDRPGMFAPMIEDMKKIREEKLLDSQVNEGKNAASLVHEANRRALEKQR